jgi:uncharacterized repeat protein (TIGR01451 family)
LLDQIIDQRLFSGILADVCFLQRDGTNETVTDANPANYFADAPAIHIVKSVNGQDADSPTGPHVAVGSTLTFTYVVTDTGNVPLANVKLFPALEVLPSDLRIKKVKYSAFICGSSDIDRQLKARNIDTLLIAGTLTNVCCESTARDAMMLDYKVLMISDANATLTDEEHAAALNTFMMFFGM